MKMAAALGDLTQIPVTQQPTQGLPRLGDVNVTLYNQDITNVVYISYQQWFKPGGGNSVPIQPLTSITISAKRAIYVAALVGGVASLMVLPEGSQAQPSPAQIATQINALGLMKDTTGQTINTTAGGTTTAVNGVPAGISTTGVPLLNLKSTQQIANALAITAGTTTALTAITGINQPAYNLHVTATAGAASTKPVYTVTLKWIDTLSGFTIQVDSFSSFMSGTSNVMSIVIAGPTDADQLQVSITNNDTVTMTVNTAFFILSSRVNYNSDICYQFWTTAGMPAVPTFQLGPAVPVPSEKILFSLSRTVGIGVTTTPLYALPVYSGPVFFHFDGGASNNWDIAFIEQTTGTVNLRQSITAAPPTVNIMCLFPRSPVGVQFTNNGSVLASMNCFVTAA